jgi:hypothetical protein
MDQQSSEDSELTINALIESIIRDIDKVYIRNQYICVQKSLVYAGLYMSIQVSIWKFLD